MTSSDPRAPSAGRTSRRTIGVVGALVLTLAAIAVAWVRDEPDAPTNRARDPGPEETAHPSTPAAPMSSNPAGTEVATPTDQPIAEARPFAVRTSAHLVATAAPIGDGAAAISVTVLVPDGAAGALPLVVFAHGFALSASRYLPLLERVARAGYVVAAPELPAASAALAVPLDPEAIVDQPAVLSAVIDDLLRPETAHDLGVTIDGERIAAMGHSDGGLTATAIAYNASFRDPRIGAAVVMTGGTIKFPGELFGPDSPPALAIHGTEDDINPFTASIAVARGVPEGTDAFLVSVLGGDHLDAFTSDPGAVDIGTVVVDFLDLELLDLTGADAALVADASIDGRFTIDPR